MSKGLAFLDRAERTDEAKRARERDRRERLRLLYVGFTRPRDLLVWVAKADPKTGVQLPALASLADETGKLLIELPFSATAGKAELRVGKRNRLFHSTQSWH